MIYLDNNASTKMDPRVRAAMEAAGDLFGNPSSLHWEGRRARQAVEEARDDVARLLDADPGEILFTSGGTEANALAILGSGSGRPGRLVRSGGEHPSVHEAFARLAGAGSSETVVGPEPSGALDAGRVAAALDKTVRIVSVMLANNEYGGVYPVAEIARSARTLGALVHTDAVQAPGRLPISVRELDLDLLSISAHKFHGPKGVGALFVRRGVRLSPHTPGGGQEKGLRAGTENTAGIVGMGMAARLAREEGEAGRRRTAALRDRLEASILARTPGARVIGLAGQRLANTSAIQFDRVAGDALAIRLDLEGVAVSVGSACSSGRPAPSAALLSLGLSREEARRVVRISLSRFTTDLEVELAGETIGRVVSEMRAAVSVAPGGVTVS